MPEDQSSNGTEVQEPEDQDQQGASGTDDGGQGGDDGQSFEGMLQEQSEEFQAAYEQHTHGLQTALQSEREERKSERDRRKELEKELREMAKKAEEGSDLRDQLNQQADTLSEQEKRAAESDERADFYEEAHRQGVSNLKLAHIAVTQDEIYDRRGNPDFQRLREEHPQLFGSTRKTGQGPPADSGKGTGQEPPAKNDMNSWIRRAAGRT